MTKIDGLDRLQRIFDAQKAATLAEPMPSLEERLSRLNRLREMIRAHHDRFGVAITADFGSLHPAMIGMLDTNPVIERIRGVEAHLEEWMKPTTVELGQEHGSSTAYSVPVPLGVNGNIAPWNFPIESALVMTVDMLGAGNTVIIKPSELAPATSQALQEAVEEFFDRDLMAVVQGGPDLAAAFSDMQWDHLTYTGSSRVGRLVMEAAGRNLVPVTLELGGKNPVLFAPDGVTADLVARFIDFRTLRSGQICTSPDYVMVQRDQVETWIELATEYWQSKYPTYVGHPDATGIINDAHFRRVVSYIDEAREEGVRVVGLNSDDPDAQLRQISLTLVIDPPDHLGCMTDEAFGPVVSVVPYDTVDEAMARINKGESPLAGYLVTYDDDLVERFTTYVRSGGTGVNTFGLQGGTGGLPFGGIGASGHGCHSGKGGFANYSHMRAVFRGSDDSFVHQVIAPPYGSFGGGGDDA